MKKGKIFAFVFIVILLAASFISVSLAESPKFTNAVSNSINSNGEARVLIILKNGTSPPGFFSLLAAPQKSVPEIVGYKNVEYSTGNSVYAVINSTSLSELQNNPQVESISPERIFHLSLATSVPLINATTVQKKIYKNYNLTGIGETVCIIDSGVDYNLADLGGCYGNNNASSNCTVIGGYNFINGTSDPMDDYGHGTHVAGIVAAHGKITGVAPGAKIIAIEACDSSGICPESYIIDGMNWCTNNATKFNISVISMSLGTNTTYSNYCDGSDASFSAAINKSVSENISVVAAAGNDGNATAISSPACMQNAISVGATTKSDVVAYYSNRDQILSLLAPGGDGLTQSGSINSTEYSKATICHDGYSNVWCSGNYAQMSGTSMATPFVSASIALLDQYLKLNNRTMTPSEIKSAFNITGKRIYDNLSNLTFSRINTYSALLSIDKESPSINLVSPLNATSSTNQSQNFICNVTDLALKNVTLELWNSTGLYNSTSLSVTGYENSSTFGLTSLPYGSYKWGCFSSDESNNTGSSGNFTLELVNYSISMSPANNTYTNTNKTFSCNFSSSNKNLTNMTFNIYNTTNLIHNETKNISGSANSTKFSYNFTKEGSYLWNCYFYTNESKNFSFGNYTIHYDFTPPNLTLVSPANSTTKTGTQNIKFEYNVSDSSPIKNCILLLNDVSVSTNSSINSISNTFVHSLSPGHYNWSINCTDYAGNINASETRYLTINSLPVSSGGGGGGSIITATLPEQPKNITEGYSISLEKNLYKYFNLSNGETHLLLVDGVGLDYANLTVESTPIRFTIYVGKEKYLNLTSPDYYNIYIKLNDIKNGTANITIKELTTGNRIFHTVSQQKENQTNGTTEKPKTTPGISFSREEIIFGVIIIIALVLAIYLFTKPKRNTKKKKRRKK